MADGYIGLFRVPDFGVPKIVLDDTPTFIVEEDNITFDPNVGGVSNALITISNIDMQSGTGAVISNIAISYSGAEGFSKKLFPVNIDDTAVNETVSFSFEGLKVPAAGTLYDFNAWFLNADDQYAYDDNASSDITELNPLTATGVGFNGVDDIAELYEVMDLVCINKDISNGEGDEANPVILPIPSIKLEWSNMQTVDPEWRLKDDGSGGTTREAVAVPPGGIFKSIKGYSIYMFISDTTAAPEFPYPSNPGEDANGEWYKMLETKDTNCEIDLPYNKYVSFWVGYRLKGYLDFLSALPNG